MYGSKLRDVMLPLRVDSDACQRGGLCERMADAKCKVSSFGYAKASCRVQTKQDALPSIEVQMLLPTVVVETSEKCTNSQDYKGCAM
jgi:hypothetical protein